MTNRRYGYAGQEPVRCICEPGADAHTEHCRPTRRVARHAPDCRHSDLWRTAVVLARRRPRRTQTRLALLHV